MADSVERKKSKAMKVLGISHEEEEDIVDDIMDEIRERAKGSIRRQRLQRLGIYKYGGSREELQPLLQKSRCRPQLLQ